MSSNFTMSKERRAECIDLLQEFFTKERDEELSEFSASLLLDFILEKLAPEFYNLGVADSYQFMNERLEDLFAIQK